jgi:hypothetical protein
MSEVESSVTNKSVVIYRSLIYRRIEHGSSIAQKACVLRDIQ